MDSFSMRFWMSHSRPSTKTTNFPTTHKFSCRAHTPDPRLVLIHGRWSPAGWRRAEQKNEQPQTTKIFCHQMFRHQPSCRRKTNKVSSLAHPHSNHPAFHCPSVWRHGPTGRWSDCRRWSRSGWECSPQTLPDNFVDGGSVHDVDV